VTKHQPPASPLTSAEGTLDPDRITLALIQALIPLGLRAVEEAPQQEVVALAGARSARDGGAPGLARWGTQRGSVYLADQNVPVCVPRVRDLQAGVEVQLTTYAQWQAPRAQDTGLFARVWGGLSTRSMTAAG
jgi:hypothetical protein